MSLLNAQDITDALRYSQQEILGTARFRGMSGAFGALGADLSAIQINPAGSALFLTSHGSVTISTGQIENNANYFGTLTNTDTRNVNLNQIGTVLVYDNFDSESSGINRFSFGIAYDQTADNANDFFVSGRSSNSIDSFFLEEAQGIPLNLISRRQGESVSELYGFLGENEGYGAQQVFLGYETFILEASDPDNTNGTSYISNIAPGNFDQRYFYETRGLNGKFTLNAAAQINQDFYLGVNLNSHFINYDRITDFFEDNNNDGSTVNNVVFSNELSTIGAGFSLQAGAIAKISRTIRVGASYESPTWYYIEEETIQRLETTGNEGRAIANPNIINIFPEYQLRTPSKLTGSLAFVFGQYGLISMDYSYKDYTTMKFSSDEGIDFSTTNQEIDRIFQEASTFRIGTEWKIENWSIRGGYSLQESPYTDDRIQGEQTGFSLGTGYNFGKFRFDVAYDYLEQELNEEFFPGSGFDNAAAIDRERENLTFTLSINF